MALPLSAALAARAYPQPSLIERAVAAVYAPLANRMLTARQAFETYRLRADAFEDGRRSGRWGAGGYAGAKPSRRQVQTLRVLDGSADTAILPALDELRARARHLQRNMPLATGALQTYGTRVVGTGLKLQPRVDREALGISESAADRWERDVARIYKHWSRRAELSGAVTMAQLQFMAVHCVLEAGDLFVARSWEEAGGTDMLATRLQLIEGDRICNPNRAADTDRIAGGIERDARGRPLAYWVADRHPWDIAAPGRGAAAPRWTRVPAVDAQGRRQVLHLMAPLRPGQSRGVPLLAPVVEALQQLADYSEAELMAAVMTACFAVVTKTDDGAGLPVTGETQGSDQLRRWQATFEPGMVLEGLKPNEGLEGFAPNRPNVAFEPFFLAVVRQIAVGIGLPFEVLVKHFTASYSAARAALLDAWETFRRWRAWLADSLCQVAYEWMVEEAVLRGYLAAPGFADPLLREAWCGAEWIGPSMGQIDPEKEVAAAKLRADLGVSTLQEITAELTGGDWEQKFPQRVKEERMRRDAGLTAETSAERFVSETQGGGAAADGAEDNTEDGDKPDAAEKGDAENGDGEKPPPPKKNAAQLALAL